MMLGNISIDGRSLKDFGVRMSLLKNRYDQPEPSVDSEHVAGRNGDILFYTGDFKNIDLNYLCVCDEGDFDTNFNGFKSWLYSHQGYMRLEDDAFPDEYRMGADIKATEIEKYRDCFELVINCKPQKYLRSGEIPVKFSESGKIFNPTDYPSKPLLKVTGTGELIIGSDAITILANDSYMMIDCELMDCYRDDENLNNAVAMTTGNFFTLQSGVNEIFLSKGMTVEITPRWYRV